MKCFKSGICPLLILTACIWLLFPMEGVAQRPTNRVLIKTHASVDAVNMGQQLGGNAHLIKNIGSTDMLVFETDISPEELMKRDIDPAIAYIEQDHTFGITGIPDDPFFAFQWNLHNTGQSGGTPGADIHMLDAWEYHTVGEERVVAGIIDSGIDWTHPDLAENIWQNLGEDADGDGHTLEFDSLLGRWVMDPGDLADTLDTDGNGYINDLIGWDFVDNDNNPYDEHGHGTHVSGTIAARGGNGQGIAGICWYAKLMPLRILDSLGNGFASAAVEALAYSRMMGAQLTNNSWGGGNFSQALSDAIEVSDSVEQLFVAAAGNNGSNNDFQPMYPASYPFGNIISVAASDMNDRLAQFSNYGKNTVDIAAPGVFIFSTLPEGSYGYMSGTSMAAPHITGTLCMFLAAGPDILLSELKTELLRTAEPFPSLTGLGSTGGRLDASESLALNAIHTNQDWKSYTHSILSLQLRRANIIFG